MTKPPAENYIEVSAFEDLGALDGGIQGEDWSKAFTQEELEQQQNELRSVIHAQQQAEIAAQ